MATTIANRYAGALADLVLAPDSGIDASVAAGQLRDMDAAFSESAGLRAVMLHPSVTPAEKRRVIERIAATLGTGALVRNFIYVLIDRRRIGFLGEIRRAFEDVVNERRGIVRAGVTTALGLQQGQREKLQGALNELTGKQIECEYAVEESLLGGVVVQMGSTVFDGSTRGRLDTLRKRLVE